MNNIYKWMDGSLVEDSYTNWLEPPNNNYVYMSEVDGWKWLTSSVQQPGGWICEKEVVTPP